MSPMSLRVASLALVLAACKGEPKLADLAAKADAPPPPGPARILAVEWRETKFFAAEPFANRGAVRPTACTPNASPGAARGAEKDASSTSTPDASETATAAARAPGSANAARPAFAAGG